MRFQRRIKIAPGLSVNLSKSGIGLSAGPRGAKVSIGPSGTYFNAGIPGTGISHRQKIGPSNGRDGQRGAGTQYDCLGLSVRIDEKGIISVVKADGNPADDGCVRKYRRTQEYKDSVRKLYGDLYEKYEQQLNDFINVYNNTPSVLEKSDWIAMFDGLREVSYVKKEFNTLHPTLKECEVELSREAEREIRSLLFWKNSAKRDEYVKKNLQGRYSSKCKDWKIAYDAFEKEEMTRRKEIERTNAQIREKKEQIQETILKGDPSYVNDALADFLSSVHLAVEFSVDFQYDGEGSLYLDLDLPEIEDLPSDCANILKSGKVSIKEKTVKQKNQDYSKCVCGLALYFAGNSFNVSPEIQQVTVSGYTQRLSKKSGNIEDTYVYSIIFDRSTFRRLNFKNIDPVQAFNNFSHVIDLTKKFELKEIVPYQIGRSLTES